MESTTSADGALEEVVDDDPLAGPPREPLSLLEEVLPDESPVRADLVYESVVQLEEQNRTNKLPKKFDKSR